MKTLQLGCGIRPIEGAINHDKEKHSDFVDVVWDLNEMPWCWQNEKFNKITPYFKSAKAFHLAETDKNFMIAYYKMHHSF